MINSAAKNPQTPARPSDLFDADDYHTWMRQAIRQRRDPTLTHLFDSTIDEPVDALAEVIRAAFSPVTTSKYVSVFGAGNPFVIDALARRYGRPGDTFIATTGATVALGQALGTLAGPGDHILIETPGFYLLEKLSAATGAEVTKIARRAPDFAFDLSELKAALRPNTKALVITNLHNPTGAYLDPEALAALAAILDRVGGILVVDEVYGDFARDASPSSAASCGDNIVAASSLTKVFGLFSLKAGWMTAAPPLLARLRAGNPEGDYGISKLAHAVAAHVLEAPAPFEAHWRGILAANRPIVARHAEKMAAAGLIEGVAPAYGCVFFPRIVGCEDSRPVARALWRDHKVLVAPGEYFGQPGHIRVGFGLAQPEKIETGMARLAEGLAARAAAAN